MMTESKRTEKLTAAVEQILNPDSEKDCVKAKYGTERGTFTIQLANFRDEPMKYNVASLDDYVPVKFDGGERLEPVDSGDIYVIFETDTESVDELLAGMETLAGSVGADLLEVETQNVQNLPSWFPEVLKPW